MHYRIRGLDPKSFAPLFLLSDADLLARGMSRKVADESPGYPCRVSLEDAAVGEELLLLHYVHHDARSPYRASGPIYVRRAATQMASLIDRVPASISHRLLSVRSYDASGMLVAAAVLPGSALDASLPGLLGAADVAYLHVHNAKPGCFACVVERA